MHEFLRGDVFRLDNQDATLGADPTVLVAQIMMFGGPYSQQFHDRKYIFTHT